MTNPFRVILPIIGICLGASGIINSYIRWRKADEEKRKKIKRYMIVSIVFGILAIVFGVIALIILYGENI